MNLAGHLATAYLVARRRRRVRWDRLGAVTVGAVAPDVIDKPVWLLGFSPYGRTVGHSLSLWGGALVLWLVAGGARLRGARALGWLVAGGLSHLLVDLVDDLVEGFQMSGFAFSAWAGWPWTNPDMWSWRVPHLAATRAEGTTALELATVALCLAWMARDRSLPGGG
ncbi:MAG TPA: hypothetical protein RMH99_27995 [Sandaracinaceae bacterium LLY-WYZ-13_1]|nr:hypothetical protein [Sandaracinaceae bacterium LLY-WYZ-13_1]